MMLARVKWSRSWREDGTRVYAHGTLLGIVASNQQTYAVIAPDTGGVMMEKPIGLVTVTTRFDWDGTHTAAVTTTKGATNGR